MPDLEKQIAVWRREMQRSGIKHPDVLDELENHLREESERRARTMTPQAAFAAAVRQSGQPAALKSEFDKIGNLPPLSERLKHALLPLAGIPQPSPAPTTHPANSNSNLEPPWS